MAWWPRPSGSGVKMQLVEAGGYTNLNTQISQIEDCVARGADAVVIGAISFDGLNNLVKEIRGKGIPVIDVINGMSSPELSAKSLVSFGEMGFKAGEYIAKLHPAGSGKVKVAWFPGPPGAGWVEAGNKGFQKAVEGSRIEVVETKYGDTGKEVQLKLVEDTLEAHPGHRIRRRHRGNGGGRRRPAARARPVGQGQDHVLLLHAGRLSAASSVARSWRRRRIRRSFRGVSRSTRRSASWKARTTRSMSGRRSTSSTDNIDTFDRGSSLAPDDFKPTFTVN